MEILQLFSLEQNNTWCKQFYPGLMLFSSMIENLTLGPFREMNLSGMFQIVFKILLWLEQIFSK